MNFGKGVGGRGGDGVGGGGGVGVLFFGVGGLSSRFGNLTTFDKIKQL